MTRPWPRGTIEYLKADVTDHDALTIEAASLDGTIELSVDRETWLPAEWDGDVFMKPIDDEGLRPSRIARTTEVYDTSGLTEERYDVWAKLTDSPEVPLMRAGTLRLI